MRGIKWEAQAPRKYSRSWIRSLSSAIHSRGIQLYVTADIFDNDLVWYSHDTSNFRSCGSKINRCSKADRFIFCTHCDLSRGLEWLPNIHVWIRHHLSYASKLTNASFQMTNHSQNESLVSNVRSESLGRWLKVCFCIKIGNDYQQARSIHAWLASVFMLSFPSFIFCLYALPRSSLAFYRWLYGNLCTTGYYQTSFHRYDMH